MLVVLPSAIAYGMVIYTVLGGQYAPQGVIAGVFGAISVGIIAPLLGGGPRIISAPCAPAAALMSVSAAELMGSGQVEPSHAMILLAAIGVLAGLFQICFGAVGGGRLIKYIPFPVVSGYLTGVGALIILGQIPKLFGLAKGVPVWEGLLTPGSWEWRGVMVGLATIVGAHLAPRFTKTVPPTVIGLSCGILGYWCLGLFYPELRSLENNRLIIGRLADETALTASIFKERWAALGAIGFGDLKWILTPAFTLAVLLSIDTLKTCVVVDTLTRHRHNANRELSGQGVANLVSGLVGGMPGAGTMGATLVNVASGGNTRLSGVVDGLCVAVVFLAFGGLISWLPAAALAGILIVVAARMLDRTSLHLLRKKSTVLDFFVIAAVVVVAINFSLIGATAVGLGLAVLLFMREQMRGSVIRSKIYGDKISSKQHRLPSEKEILRERGNLITVCELQGSLFFGTTDQLFTEIEPDLKRARFVILDMRRVQSVDFTAVHMLEQIQAILNDMGGHLIFSHLPPFLPSGRDLQAYFDQLGLVRRVQNTRIFTSLNEALEWAEDQVLKEYSTLHDDIERPLALAEIELFREFDADQGLPLLRECVAERSFKGGETIFKKDTAGDELFIIRRGIVRVVLPLEGGRHHVLAVFARGSFFGEIAFLDRGHRSADAVADRDTDLFALSRVAVDKVSKADPRVGARLFARLAHGLALRLRYADAELRALKEA